MTLTVVDMHTGGEPLRIVTGGYPAIPKGTILEKRAYVRDHLDHLRRILMFEPRGHYDIYGALLVEPDLPGADLAVLFMHNEGYSTMCGHAIVALGRYAIDEGLVAKREPITIVNIEAPCGLVVASVEVRDGKAGAVSFESVPAFLFARDLRVELPVHGMVTFDIAYGGAFYALADCRQFGLEFGRDRVRDFVDAATALTERAKRDFPLSHPDHADLAFLYGTILTDGSDEFSSEPTRNVCVFADAEVEAGLLKPVLPDWRSKEVPMYALFASHRLQNPSLRLMINSLTENFSDLFSYPYQITRNEAFRRIVHP